MAKNKSTATRSKPPTYRRAKKLPFTRRVGRMLRFSERRIVAMAKGMPKQKPEAKMKAVKREIQFHKLRRNSERKRAVSEHFMSRGGRLRQDVERPAQIEPGRKGGVENLMRSTLETVGLILLLEKARAKQPK